ncbi:PAS domain-containing hybrid sensor histidine kinase/response regulator [Sphingomonas astaxanthinifaciens]|uniref:histidine kinase n=1 Tax=Sphingomonas astaxanthinifaciens DSM 22298 TaxID=1123267 RepID=A0ABQ5Z7E3_9SPHN|nr:PAS domain S-box protein [Sphingomonas astaxanthinifaciens]GLR47884.1 hypothetical protein GCM10007925_15970 [Sphingomonas astaxanthinifaciens DSM 22298]
MTLQQRISLPGARSLTDGASIALVGLDAEMLSHLIAETTRDAFVAVDRENRIAYWNHGAEAMFGWTRAEAIGQSLHLIIPPAMREAHVAGMDRVMKGGEPRLVGKAVEVTALRKEGEPLPVELSLTMWTEPGTDIPAGFAAIMRDISARKALEDERNAYALRLEEQMQAIEATNDGIAITDAEGHFIFMNTAHARLFGYASAKDAIGLHWSRLYDANEAERIVTEAMPAVGAQGSWRGHAFGRHRDGHLIEQEVTLSAGANGGIVCTTRDIGERQRALRERIRTREQLLIAERQEMIGRVVSGMAHDFNNLMAVITASAAALEQDGGADNAQVHRIQSAANAAGKLLRKILRPERRVSEHQSVDLSRVVREVAELIEVSLRPGHSVTVELPDEPIAIDADESEFMQVLMNLCTNARDALSPDGPGQILLSYREGSSGDFDGAPAVGVMPSGRFAVVRVEDDGSGIAPDVLDRIFDPFVSRKKDSGTGLGLSVVSKLVTEAGGAIYVRSSTAGCCFDIAWPIERRSTPDAQPEAPVDHISLAGRAILSIDDNPALLDLIALHLERAGAEVCPCLSPADGLDVLRDRGARWDAIVVDFDMPQMNGVEFATAARQLRPEIPIVLCSAVAEDLVISAAARKMFAAITSKTNLHLHLPRAVASVLPGPDGEDQK